MKKILLIFITVVTLGLILPNCGGEKTTENKEKETEDANETEEETTEEQEENSVEAALTQDIEEYVDILCSLNEAVTQLKEAKEKKDEVKIQKATDKVKSKDLENRQFVEKMREKYKEQAKNDEMGTKVETLSNKMVKENCGINGGVGEIMEAVVNVLAEENNPEPPVMETETPIDEEF